MVKVKEQSPIAGQDGKASAPHIDPATKCDGSGGAGRLERGQLRHEAVVQA